MRARSQDFPLPCPTFFTPLSVKALLRFCRRGARGEGNAASLVWVAFLPEGLPRNLWRESGEKERLAENKASSQAFEVFRKSWATLG